MIPTIYRGIKGRLYPNDTQKQQIAQAIGNERFIWNQFLGMMNERYSNNKEFPCLKRRDLQDLLRPLKWQHKFLKDSDSTSHQFVTKKLSEAFQAFFDGVRGRPKFQKKYYSGAYHSTGNNNSIRQNSKSCVQLPKLKAVKYRGPCIEGKILNATISVNAAGQYFVSFTVERKSQASTNGTKAIGIDLGVADFITTSDGEKVKLPAYRKRLRDKRLKWEQITARRRDVAKDRLGEYFRDGKNYQKARQMVAKIRQKEVNQRNDFLHKLSTQLVRDYDIIIMEDLNVKGMMKTNHLAEEIAYSAWRKFTDMVRYKAEEAGKVFITVDPAFTSQKCSSCRRNTGKKELKVRDFTCQYCSAEHDRDINAAINILNRGLAIL